MPKNKQTSSKSRLLPKLGRRYIQNISSVSFKFSLSSLPSCSEMVDAITGFVVGKMGNYLIDEASMLIGVKEDLEELKTELTCIQGYLKDVEAREKEDEVSKEWTKLVLDIAYDVEDVLDWYNLKAVQRSQRQGFMRLTKKFGETMDSYRIIDDVRILKRRIMDVTRKRETYGIGNFNEPRGGNTTRLKVRQLRRARSVDQEERVVGLADDAKILLAKLLNNDDGDNKRYMISIFGMGGLGKTALARKLYNSRDVKRRFQYRAWTYVSQEYKTRDVLMRVIRSLGSSSAEEIEKMRTFGEEELEVYLYGLLQGKKYLVVVDDIWEREAWESLKRALPENHKGSRVIITTRIRTVAEGVDGRRVNAHKLRFLTFKESWNLFERKAFRDINHVDQELQKTGELMVRKCGGLPLAIVVLAGLLSRKRQGELTDMCGSLWRRLKEDSIHVYTVFDLSFVELPHELKLCFLYLSVFPEDYEIDVEKLIRLLVAEGFIQEDGEMMIEDTARYYIEELIDRSLVEAVRIKRGTVMSCRIHDLLRDVAIKKAKELNFVNVYNENCSSTTCRREVVHNKRGFYSHERSLDKRMRSLLFFGEEMRTQWRDFNTDNLRLKLLRVLDLQGIMILSKEGICLGLPDVVGELVHLRYLGIANTRLKSLPSFIPKLRFLQTLDASGNDLFKGITNLSNFTSVRHLLGLFVGELILGDTFNLRTLRSISSYSWSKLKQESLKNLRDLEIYDAVYLRQNVVSLDLSSFSKLTNLRALTLKVPTFKLSSEEAVRFQTLVEFTLRCGVRRIPRDMDLMFPSLESLTLVAMKFEEDPMPALQELQRLEDLALQNCDCSGEKMSISAKGFGRLRKLGMIKIILDELQIEEEAMPNLVKLNLTNRE